MLKTVMVQCHPRIFLTSNYFQTKVYSNDILYNGSTLKHLTVIYIPSFLLVEESSDASWDSTGDGWCSLSSGWSSACDNNSLIGGDWLSTNCNDHDTS